MFHRSDYRYRLLYVVQFLSNPSVLFSFCSAGAFYLQHPTFIVAYFAPSVYSLFIAGRSCFDCIKQWRKCFTMQNFMHFLGAIVNEVMDTIIFQVFFHVRSITKWSEIEKVFMSLANYTSDITLRRHLGERYLSIFSRRNFAAKNLWVLHGS